MYNEDKESVCKIIYRHKSIYQNGEIKYHVTRFEHCSISGLPGNFAISDINNNQLFWGKGTYDKYAGWHLPYEIHLNNNPRQLIKISESNLHGKVDINYMGKVTTINLIKTKHIISIGHWKIEFKFRLCSTCAFISTEKPDDLRVPVAIIYILTLLRKNLSSS